MVVVITFATSRGVGLMRLVSSWISRSLRVCSPTFWCANGSHFSAPGCADIPYNDFFSYYGPDFQLHLQPLATLQNGNTRESLDRTRIRILQQLKELDFAPSVQMQAVPPDYYLLESLEQQRIRIENDQEKSNERITAAMADQMIEHPAELYDDEQRAVHHQSMVDEDGTEEGGTAAARDRTV